MNDVFWDFLGPFVAVYLDEICIFYLSLEEHHVIVKRVLRENRLLQKWKSVSLWWRVFPFWGI